MASGETTNYKFKYPKPSDPLKVAKDVQELAEQLDSTIAAKDFTKTIGTAYRSTEQKIKNTTFERVQVNSVVNESGTGLLELGAGKGWYVAPAEGWYHAEGVVLVEIPTTQAITVESYIYLNEVRQVSGSYNTSAANTRLDAYGGSNVSGVFKAKAGEHIEFWVYQSSGAERPLFTVEAAYNRLSVFRIG